MATALAGRETSAGEAREPVLKTEHFDRDPGWEGHNNWSPDKQPVKVSEDFGYSPTCHARGKAAGEIGGRVRRASRIAFYGKRLPRGMTLDDPLHCTGRFVVTRTEGMSNLDLGWFNSLTADTAYPTNRLRMGINGESRGCEVSVGCINSQGQGHGVRATGVGPRYPKVRDFNMIPVGTVYTFNLHYDPGGNNGHGRIIFSLGGDGPFTAENVVVNVPVELRKVGAQFDSFGMINSRGQPGGTLAVFFDDLTINGEPLTFDNDPAWAGRNNRATFDDDFKRGAHDFGYQPGTQHAGGKPGEIGGVIFSDNAGYYGDDVGRLTLDDHLIASGRMALTERGSEAGFYLGWFNSHERGYPPKNLIGAFVEGPNSVGSMFRPIYATSNPKIGTPLKKGPVIDPFGKNHQWRIEYHPDAADGHGELKVSVDGETAVLTLAPKARRQNTVFNRFGIAVYEGGGQWSKVFLDDLQYTNGASVGSRAIRACAQGDLVQLQQDFSKDPRWDWSNNRVEASHPPTVTQDFGWSPGKIGGTVWKSTTPAWCGMPLEPTLSFKNAFSASGKISVTRESFPKGVAYLGYFNHERQGWRPWSSMALRLVNAGDKVFLYVDYMTGRWNAGAAEMELSIPADGSEHTWRLAYDPNATRAPWSDLRLRGYLTTGRQTVDEILAKAQHAEPGLARAALEQRLKAALQDGLVSFLPRHGKQFWLLKQDKEQLKGAVTVQVDGGREFRSYLPADMRDQPVVLDRFGIFNMQLYHGALKFFVSDLTVNGRRVDLGKDMGWDGRGNRTTFVERDFQRQNFGYSPDTALAGGQKGEIGGQFYNVEPIDPLHGYYADYVGRLTLDDPIRFSGKISFIEGSTDAGTFFGYFRAEDEKQQLPPNIPNFGGLGWPQPNVLGVVVDGPARIGWYFMPVCTASERKLTRSLTGTTFLPTREHRTFDFVYDPQANNGVGRITVTLDGQKPFSLDLTPEQRRAGATFNRFGLMSFRRGGKYSTLYFDDLTYTARRSPSDPPLRREQEIITVPYPPSGRKF